MKRMMMAITMVMAAILLVATSAPVNAEQTDTTAKLNVPQLIDLDLEEGLIDYSEALRLKITWFKKSELLPEKYQQAIGNPLRCATPVVMEIDRNFHRLEKEDLDLLRGMGLPDLPTILARPSYSYTLQSATMPLRVHYETEDQLDRAQQTLEAYEFSWQRECNEIGFYEPPGDYGTDGSDDYDVYLSNTGTGVLGYTTPEQQVTETWWNDRTSYIVNSRSLNTDALIKTTSSHEFNHACQFAMAYEELIAFYENTATWVEPHVYFEHASDAWDYAWYCQREPWKAICWFDNGGLFHYGGFLWPEYFSDRFSDWGPELIPQAWELCRDESGNATDYFDAMVTIAEQEEPGGPRGDGWHLYDLLTEFTEYRYFCRNEADSAHFTHAENFNRVTISSEHRHMTLPALCPQDLPHNPEFYAVSYVRFDEAITDQETLTIFFEGEKNFNNRNYNWRLMIIKIYEPGGAYDIEIHDAPPDSPNLLLEVTEANQCERLVMAVINLGAGGTNPGMNMPDGRFWYMAWAEEDPNMSLLVAAPGPGETNLQAFRSFLSSDPSLEFSELWVNQDNYYGLNVACGDIDGNNTDEIVTGHGPDPTASPTFAAYRLNGEPLLDAEAVAYGVEKYGVNVACGDIDGDGDDEIITGAGPGAVFGPHVRGWNYADELISSMPGVSYFAYGTLKYGVNVASGDIDGDGYDEIITGAGPGSVFGPHVRAWDYDASGSTTPVPGVSYFAYGSPKWGVNVAAGDIDGDGFDEIVTGAGPGAIYGPHVRGWNFDGGSLAAIPGVSYFAYGSLKYGVNVTCGDVDNDGIDEIVTGAGPGQIFGAHVRGWDYDGDTLTAIGSINYFAFNPDNLRFGAKVAVADLQVN